MRVLARPDVDVIAASLLALLEQAVSDLVGQHIEVHVLPVCRWSWSAMIGDFLLVKRRITHSAAVTKESRCLVLCVKRARTAHLAAGLIRFRRFGPGL